jgi:hypothetical protein
MTAIGGASLSGGMAAGRRDGMGIGMGGVAGRRTFALFGYEGGIGMGGGMIGTAMTQQASMPPARSGPGLGYPFRMPADLPGAPAGMGAMAP